MLSVNSFYIALVVSVKHAVKSLLGIIVFLDILKIYISNLFLAMGSNQKHFSNGHSFIGIEKARSTLR